MEFPLLYSIYLPICSSQQVSRGGSSCIPHLTSLPSLSQGEDVVAGTRTPLPISVLLTLLPDVHCELLDVTTRLEAHMKDMMVGVEGLNLDTATW